jgi:hypothetical protein
MPIERAGSDVRVTPDVASNTFEIKIGDQTVRASPKQFGDLLESGLTALAQQLHGRMTADRAPFRRGQVTTALTLTDLLANSDLGAQNFVVEAHVGAVVLHFACTQGMMADFCGQVASQLQSASTTPERSS